MIGMRRLGNGGREGLDRGVLGEILAIFPDLHSLATSCCFTCSAPTEDQSYLGLESCRLGPRHKAGQKAAPSWVIHLYARVCSCLPSPCTSRVAGLRPPTRREGKIEVQMTGKRAEPYLRPSSRRIAICVAFVTPATFFPTPAWAPCHVSTQ